MTISNTLRTAGPFTGNGVTVIFPFVFKVFQFSEVQVVTTANTTGKSTQLVLNTDYIVSLNPDQNASPGGNVVLTSPLPNADKLVLTSAVDYLQPVDLTNAGGFYPTVINSGLDRLTILCQQLYATAIRSLRFPVADTGADTELPSLALRANKLLGFDQNGKPVAYAPVSGSASDVAATLANTVSNYAASTGSSLVGFLQDGTGAVPRTVQEKNRDIMAVKDFMIGVTANDDTLALERAFAKAAETGRPVEMPRDRDLYITRPIDVKITANVPVAPATLGIHYTPSNPLGLRGQGGKFIRAAPNFAGAHMIRFIYDSANTRPAPYWSYLEDLSLDGSGLAPIGIVSEFSINMSMKRVRIIGVATGAKWIGYGVANIERCFVFADTCFDFVQGGGDSWITKNDLFPKSRGVTVGALGGNMVVDANIFTRQDSDFPASSKAIGVAVVDSTNEVRDIRVSNNEFCGMAVATSFIGGASKNVKRIDLIGNHLTPSAGGALWTAGLVYAENVRELKVTGNKIGSGGFILPLTTDAVPGVNLLGCVDARITGNNFSNLRRPAMIATSSTGLCFNENTVRDVGQEGVSSTVIYLDTVDRSLVSNNVAYRSSTSFGATFVTEAGTSTANKGVGNNANGFGALSVLAGGSTSTYS